MSLSPFVWRLVLLLGIDILLGFIYAIIPTSLTIARDILAFAQLVTIAATLWVAIRRVLEDY